MLADGGTERVLPACRLVDRQSQAVHWSPSPGRLRGARRRGGGRVDGPGRGDQLIELRVVAWLEA